VEVVGITTRSRKASFSEPQVD